MRKITLKKIEKEFDKRIDWWLDRDSPDPREFIKKFYQDKITELLEWLDMEKITSVDVSRLKGELDNGDSKWEKIGESKEAKFGFNQAVSKLNKKIERIKK